MKLHQTFKRNKLGRDFVVGDIHGAYNLLGQAMAGARFNPSLDRLFLVGDLIDRGPDSARALDLLSKNFAHAIRGNHDHDFSQMSLPEIKALAAQNWNGLSWALGVPDATLAQMQRKFAALPITMQIETERGTVGLVHGEVPVGMDWAQFTSAIESEDGTAIHSALWGRERAEGGIDCGVLGIDRLFCGHTIQWSGPRRLGNVYFVDTGAVFHELGHAQGSMTMAHIACCSATICEPSPQAAQAAINLFPHKAAGPFGAYATDAFKARKP